MQPKNIHVVPYTEDDSWTVKVESGDGVGQRYATRQDAIKAGTERARRDKVALIIYGRDGQIRERNSFGQDPRNVKN